jgi:hypothetical protein
VARHICTEQEGLIPKLDGGDEEYFYDNPNVFLPDSKNEEGGQEFEFDDVGVRRPTPIDHASIKYIFRDETWSQCTNEYVLGAIPFTMISLV